MKNGGLNQDVAFRWSRSARKDLRHRNVSAVALLLSLSPASQALAVTPAWSGAGAYRVLLRVDPVSIGGRPSDEMPAQYAVNFLSLVPGGNVDLSTLQVHKYDPTTGQAETFPTFDNSRSPYDRPCRFEDTQFPRPIPITRAMLQNM